MKKWMTSLVIGLASLVLVACGQSTSKQEDSLAAIQEKGTLVVALSPDYAPFEFKTLVDGKDTLVGADVELAKLIGEELGVTVEFSTMSFNNVLASLSTGKADIAISGLSPTEERQKAYDFSDIYYEAKNVVVIRKEDVSSYTDAASFADQSLAAQKGSIQEGIVTEQFAEANLVSLVQTNEMINELKSGQVAGVVLEGAIAEGYVAKNSDLMIADITITEDADSLGSAVAMPKGSTSLQEKINSIIADLKASGKIDQLVQEAYTLSLEATVVE